MRSEPVFGLERAAPHQFDSRTSVRVAKGDATCARDDPYRPEDNRLAREPHPAIGKRKTVNSSSDAEVIGRSLDEPEAFGLIYDRHAERAARRTVQNRVRAAQDLRYVARERLALAVRDRVECVAEAPARRGSATARERPDGGG